MVKHVETIFAQIGNQNDEKTGAINTPLYFSTAYQHPGIGQTTGYDYIRTANPTRDVLQAAIAEIEGGKHGFATSSGMAAIQLTLEALLDHGDQVLTLQDLYGGTYRYFHALEEKKAYKFHYCLSEAELLNKLSDKIKLVFIESPTNPMMTEFDIAAVAKQAHQAGAVVVVDNTFYTPLLQQPLSQGADVVVHSATKYLAGHNDVLAGLVTCINDKIGEKLAFQLNTTGATLAPFDCWLVMRGMKTLPLRMKQHQRNAQTIVAYLEQEALVDEVFYTGKGGMVTFAVKNKNFIEPLLNQLQIFTFAESLGGVESLITYPTTQTHADIPQDLRESYGLRENILRISTGIEHAEDLVSDLQQAFNKVR